jgi:hypothetical protein
VSLAAELALSVIVMLAQLMLRLLETSHQPQHFDLRPSGR